MRAVRRSEVGEILLRLIAENHPVEEDIGILDEDGNLLRVVITTPPHPFTQLVAIAGR